MVNYEREREKKEESSREEMELMIMREGVKRK